MPVWFWSGIILNRYTVENDEACQGSLSAPFGLALVKLNFANGTHPGFQIGFDSSRQQLSAAPPDSRGILVRSPCVRIPEHRWPTRLKILVHRLG